MQLPRLLMLMLLMLMLPGNTWRGVLKGLRGHASCRRLSVVQTGVFACYKNFNKVRSGLVASLCCFAACSRQLAVNLSKAW
jgi:hypothetical protein